MFFESFSKPKGDDNSEAEPTERIKSLFCSLDRNHDGRVDVSEIARRLRELASAGQTSPSAEDEQRIEEIARELVENAKSSMWSWFGPLRDKEPSLSLDEFTNYLLSRERALRSLFTKIDLDKDAHITADELAAWLKAANIKMKPEQVEKLVKKMDVDGNHTIEWDEFRDFAVFIPQMRASRSFNKAPNQRELVVFYATIFGQVAAGDQLEMGYAVPPKASSELSGGRTVEYVLSGGISAAVSRTVTAPLDRIRVYFQNGTNRLHFGGAMQVQGQFGAQFSKALKDIYANGGLRSFWRGNSLELIKMIPGSAFQFTAFEFSKSMIATMVEGKEDRAHISDIGRFFAGGVAGATAMVAGFPLSTVKTRVMSNIVTDQAAQTLSSIAGGGIAATITPAQVIEKAEGSFQRRSHIGLQTASNMWKSGGIRAFYKGLPVALLGIVPYSGTNLALFELLRREFVNRFDHMPSNGSVLVMGSISAGTGSLLVYPIQLVRTRLQAQGTPSHPYTYKNGMDVVRRTLVREGFSGLYKGIVPSLMKVLPSAAITRLVFETSKGLFGLT